MSERKTLTRIIQDFEREIVQNYGMLCKTYTLTVSPALFNILHKEALDIETRTHIPHPHFAANYATELFSHYVELTMFTSAGRITIRKDEDAGVYTIKQSEANRTINTTPKQSAISPSHYSKQGKQVWDMMRGLASADEYRGYLMMNVVKYVSRFKQKNGKEDLLKARTYIDKLIETEYGEERSR